MQLLTTKNYSLHYQCYTHSDEESWGGTIDFTPEADYADIMSWYKTERESIVENLTEYAKTNREEVNLEQFWFIIAKEEDMISVVESLSEEELQRIINEDAPRNQMDAQSTLKSYCIVNKPSGFVQWHKHPKRMSDYGRESLTRLKSGLYKTIGVQDHININKSDYNCFALEASKV